MPTLIKIDNNFSDWLQFLEKANENQLITIAHNPSLANVLQKTFGYIPKYYYLKEEAEVVGVFPGFQIGKKIVSIPHFSYGDAILKNNYTFNYKLINSQFEIRGTKKNSEYFNDEKVFAYINLNQDTDTQFASFKSKLRSQIRKGYSYGVEVFIGKNELLSDFYLIYTKNMLELGSPALPVIFFLNLLDLYKYGESKIVVVKFQNKPVAAGFTLSFMGFNEVCWASSDHKFNKYNFNMVLYWELIKNSIESGNKYFSFGRSSENSNTLKFKLQWGDVIVKQLYFNFSEEQKINIKKFHIISKIWSFLPYKISIILSKFLSGKLY